MSEQKQIKILAIVGSLRKESFNLQLAKAAKAYLPENVSLEILDYADIPYMNQDIEFPAPAAIQRVRDAVNAADGLWIFTPEYNHSYPGVLKNLIDWLSRPQGEGKGNAISGKPTAISGCSMGTSGTAVAQDILAMLLAFLNVDVMNSPRLTIPAVHTQVKDGKLDLASSASYLEKQAQAFVKYIEARK